VSSHVDGTFEVVSFTRAEVTPAVDIATALPTGVVTMEKSYTGAVSGTSATLFTYAMDDTSGTATYVALESFAGSLDGRSGAFNFVHLASTHGQDRYGEFFTIVDASGTGDLAGIRGGGGLAVDADGTHRIWFDYDL